MDESPRALDGILKEPSAPEMLHVLTELSGTALNTLLLEVMRRRAKNVSPADLLRAYRENRLAGPAAVPWEALRRVEDVVPAVLPDSFEVCELSPVVPLGGQLRPRPGRPEQRHFRPAGRRGHSRPDQRTRVGGGLAPPPPAGHRPAVG